MWKIYGQDHITRQLDAAIRADRLSHAYLLVGPPHVGKMSLALNIAQAVNCRAGGRVATRQQGRPVEISPDSESTAGLFTLNTVAPAPASSRLLEGPRQYDSDPGTNVALEAGDVPCGQCPQCQRVGQGIHPDVRIIGIGTGEDEGTNRRDIRIEQVRDIESFLNLTPYEGLSKVVIVDGAESMNTAAASALLKTLEEPPEESLLLLLASNEDALLPTIRSRCSALYLKPAARAEMQERLTQDYNADPALAERLARISRGCFGHAVNALGDSQVLEQREADLDRLQQVCESGLDLRFDYAAELATRFGRDRDAARELLYLWLRWWRDLLLIKEGAETFLHNADRATPLRLQATRLTTRQIVAFIKRLNHTLEALDANANPRLTLEALMLGLPRVQYRSVVFS